MSSLQQAAKASVVLQFVGHTAKWCCIFYCMKKYGVSVTKCQGPSMKPTFNSDGDYLLVNRIPFLRTVVSPGDVVISNSPSSDDAWVVKRVVALPGHPVRVSTPVGTVRTLRVPEGHVWLQGDNPNNSRDSRHYGPVPLEMLVGHVFLRFRKWTGFALVRSDPAMTGQLQVPEDENVYATDFDDAEGGGGGARVENPKVLHKVLRDSSAESSTR